MERYTKVRNIGKGNMGTCLLAKDNEDGKFYVIKQVDLAKLSKKERQQSLNEAKVLSALRHPNIINYVDSFLAKKSDHLCIVMEFADGGDLCNKVKYQRGVRFSEEQVLDWFIQTVLALQHMHRRKILHRDVKTQNIFLTSENLAKLGDFGISKALSGTYEQTNTFVGTPYYLSPELILEKPYDHMSDVWALGIVLYELMALRHPFNANDMKSLMHRILRVQYDPPPLAYSDGLRSIVGKILTKDPNQRIRLNEILELPVIQNRLKVWVSGGSNVVPPKYLSAMARNKLFPPSIMALIGPTLLPSISNPTSKGNALNMTETALPLIPGGSASSGLNQNSADLMMGGGNAQQRNNANSDDVNKLVPKPPPPLQGLPTRLNAQGGGAYPSNVLNNADNKRPVPSGLANNYNMHAQQNNNLVNKPPYAASGSNINNGYLPTPNPRAGHLPPVATNINGCYPTTNNNYGAYHNQQQNYAGGVLPVIQNNRVPVQPSLRPPLPGNPYGTPQQQPSAGYNPPSSLPSPQPSSEIQSLLAKAAQERIALRNGRRW